MTEVQQGPTPRVHFRGVRFNEVSVKRELTVYESQDSMGFHNPHEFQMTPH